MKTQNPTIICPRCRIENSPGSEYCSDCHKRLKPFPRIIFLAAILFLIFFLFSDMIGVYVKVNSIADAAEPDILIKEMTTLEPVAERICQNKSFAFTTLGGNVDSVGKYVRPNLIINNLEDKWGIYTVFFYFMSEKRFPYDRYGRLEESLGTGALKHSDADFRSITYEFYLGPGESRLINNLTLSGNASGKSWAIADITEPEFFYCFTRTTYINKTENRTFSEEIPEKRIESATEFRSLKELLGIDSFFDWFLIISLVLIILMLLYRIYGLRKS